MPDHRSDGASVAAIIQHRVVVSARPAYERWLREISEVARTHDGHIAGSVLKPRHEGDDRYSIVVQFRDQRSLDGWLGSNDRRQWLQRAEPYISDVEHIDYASGLEALVLPPRSNGPPRWKLALLTFAGVYLINVIVYLSFGPALATLPWLLRLALGAAIVVACLAWVVMPRLTRWFARWLRPTVTRAG